MGCAELADGVEFGGCEDFAEGVVTEGREEGV